MLSYEANDNNDGMKRNASKPGCIDAITLDLMWITGYIVGLCFIAIFVDVLVISSIGIMLRMEIREKGNSINYRGEILVIMNGVEVNEYFLLSSLKQETWELSKMFAHVVELCFPATLKLCFSFELRRKCDTISKLI